MYTKTQLLQSIPDVPARFSMQELERLLNRPHPAVAAPVVSSGLARLPPATANEPVDYTSPEALALYAELAARFPASATVAGLHGLVRLPAADEQKSAQDWRAQSIREKHGL